MSQTRGGNAGYRAKPNSRRQAHHAATPNRAARGQPSSRASESGPAQAASIIKTRSLKFLVDAVGAENIALGLESSLARVAELMRGERFTPETAFHMETTLGLPSGFFDQHHPVLSPEMIARLKSPLEFAHTNATSDEVDVRPHTASDTHNRSLLVSSLSEKMNMRSKSSKDAPGAAKTRSTDVEKQVSGQAPAAASSPKHKRSRQAAEQRPAHSDGDAGVERIRRANLHVLTRRNGSKVKLGAVMGLSGSNMAHRLHGKKRMDDAEAERFTERLGLPRGWLDAPRSPAEIPESVTLLLAPTSRAQGRGQTPAPSAAVGNDAAPSEAAPRKTDSTLTGIPSDEQVAAWPTDALSENDRLISGPDEEVDDAVAASADESVEQATGQVPIVVAAAVASPAVPPTSQQTTTPSTSLFETSLEGLNGIAPIAEALLKTLAGKARTGRLDELKALELLQQAVLL